MFQAYRSTAPLWLQLLPRFRAKNWHRTKTSQDRLVACRTCQQLPYHELIYYTIVLCEKKISGTCGEFCSGTGGSRTGPAVARSPRRDFWRCDEAAATLAA